VAENKTKASGQGPDRYLAAIGNAARRLVCEQLMALMSKATRQSAVMWGTAIVGFGVHRYALAGGKQGEICAVGFSSRKGDISIYGVLGASGADGLLAKLGKYERGKGCLYVARMAEIDKKVLGQLVTRAFKEKHAGP
jgi:hypothetical protein